MTQAQKSSVDRNTFNYGRALGAPLHLLEYTALVHYQRALASIAIRMSQAAWALEMALKKVRDAETTEEQSAAMLDARKVHHTVDRATEKLECAPIKFFRYGRIGDVLRTFTPKFNR